MTKWMTFALGFLAMAGAARADWWDENQCPRAIPVPAFREGVLQHTFSLDGERGVAIEAALIDGAPVTISHSGCENLTWVFAFPSSADGKTSAAISWALLVKRLHRIVPDAPGVGYLPSVLKYMEQKTAALPGFGAFVYADGDASDGIAIGIDMEGRPAVGEEPSAPYTLTFSISAGPL